MTSSSISSLLSDPNPDDPLIIHFRIRSTINPKVFYSKLTRYLLDPTYSFPDKFLGDEYGYEGNGLNGDQIGKNVVEQKITDLRNKVIIICDQENFNWRSVKKFHKLVNLSSGSANLTEYRQEEILLNPIPEDISAKSTKGMVLCMPGTANGSGPSNENLPAELSFSYGCQMVCMNYSNDDANLEFYLDKFNTAKTAFILKPAKQRYTITYIKAPTPQNPVLNYAAKSTTGAGGVKFGM